MVSALSVSVNVQTQAQQNKAAQVQHINSAGRSFQSHLSQESNVASTTKTYSDGINADSIKVVQDMEGINKAPSSRMHLNQFHNEFVPGVGEDGMDIAVKAKSLAKKFEAFFLKEMWKNIDGFKLSNGQEADMISNIWGNKLIEEWFAGVADDEGGQLAKQMAEQMIEKYQYERKISTLKESE